MTKLAGGTAAALAAAFLLCAGVMVLSEDTDAADPYTAGGVVYTLSGTNATVSNDDKGTMPTDGKIVIPATIKVGSTTYNVTKIGNNAFDGNTLLASAVIPDSVTSIGDYASR